MSKKSPNNLLTVVAKSVGSAIGTIANTVRVTRGGTHEIETVEAPRPKVASGRVSKSRGKRAGSVAKKRPSKSAGQKRVT
jgi:hypothetical protein